MYFYSISVGNPEGIDFTLMLCHENQMTNDEFQKISEEAFVYALEIEYEKRKSVFISSLSHEHIYEYMMKHGFKAVQETASYDLEPYFSKETVKSDKLKQWINRESGEDEPGYF